MYFHILCSYSFKKVASSCNFVVWDHLDIQWFLKLSKGANIFPALLTHRACFLVRRFNLQIASLPPAGREAFLYCVLLQWNHASDAMTIQVQTSRQMPLIFRWHTCSPAEIHSVQIISLVCKSAGNFSLFALCLWRLSLYASS